MRLLPRVRPLLLAATLAALAPLPVQADEWVPPCNLADPASIPSKYEPLLRVPVNTRSASVQIIYRDGSASAVEVFPR